MKRNIKLFITLSFVILGLTGCTNKDMKAAYDKMQVNDNMNGYTIDLRLYGNNNSSSVNESVRVENYMNKSYSIMKSELKDDEIVENNLYYVDGQMYKEDDLSYVQTTDTSTYTNTNIYLEGLINTSKVTEASDEVIANNTYKVYNIVVKKDFINSLVKYLPLTDYSASHNINAKVYVNNDGYVYKTIYNLKEKSTDNEDLTLNVVYFGFNTSREIVIK